MTDQASAVALENIDSALSDRGTGRNPGTLPGIAYAGDVFHITFNSDCSRLIGFSRTQGHIWDTKSGRKTLTFKGDMNEVFCVASSGDGKRVATGDRLGNVKLWNAETGALLAILDEGPDARDTDYVWTVTFSPDGKTLATGYDHHLRLWEVGSLFQEKK